MRLWRRLVRRQPRATYRGYPVDDLVETFVRLNEMGKGERS